MAHDQAAGLCDGNIFDFKELIHRIRIDKIRSNQAQERPEGLDIQKYDISGDRSLVHCPYWAENIICGKFDGA